MSDVARSRSYVHGYDPRETARLQDQAATLEELLHSDTSYPEGSLVLEAGCGVGAQTVPLARNSPGARIVSVDISAESIASAEAQVAAAGLTNVEFHQADIFGAPRASCRDPGPAEWIPQTGRYGHRHRRGPRVGLLPSRQRGGS